MSNPKIITVPEAEELMQRLIAVDNNQHMIEQFYPRLMPLAGENRVGAGIAVALTLAVSDYTAGQPVFMAATMQMRMHEFVGAFTDDPEVRAEALSYFAAAGLPTG